MSCCIPVRVRSKFGFQVGNSNQSTTLTTDQTLTRILKRADKNWTHFNTDKGTDEYSEHGNRIHTTLAIPSFLATNAERKAFQFEKIHQVGIPDYECLEKHVIENNPINIQIDGRLVIEYENGS